MNTFVKKKPHTLWFKKNKFIIPCAFVFLKFGTSKKAMEKKIDSDWYISYVVDNRQPTRWDWQNDFRNSGKEYFVLILI